MSHGSQVRRAIASKNYEENKAIKKAKEENLHPLLKLLHPGQNINIHLYTPLRKVSALQ